MSSEDHAFGGHFSLLVLHPDHIFFYFPFNYSLANSMKDWLPRASKKSRSYCTFYYYFRFFHGVQGRPKKLKKTSQEMYRRLRNWIAQKINKKAELMYIFSRLKILKYCFPQWLEVTTKCGQKKARLEGERMIDCMFIWHF